MKYNWIGHILYRKCLLKHVAEGKIKGTGSRRKICKQLLNKPYGNKKILESEIGSTRSHCGENSVWKGLWTCRKKDCIVAVLLLVVVGWLVGWLVVVVGGGGRWWLVLL